MAQRMWPSVRRLLAQHPSLAVVATGPKGMVTKGDVIAALEGGSAMAPAAAAAAAAAAPQAAAAQAAAQKPAASPMGYTEEAPSNVRKARGRCCTLRAK